MQGTGSFLPLAIGNIVATAGMITSLKLLATPETFGLTGVWLSFTIFNSIRFAAVALFYQRNGPLAPRNILKAEKAERGM